MADAEEPLPVGAHDPETAQTEEPALPPGMPHQPDDLDREMAERAHRIIASHRLSSIADNVRPDLASVADARRGRVTGRALDVRGSLLLHASERAEEERRALLGYADALRSVQESRDAYVAAKQAREKAEDALCALGLDDDRDHEEVAAQPAVAPITDDMIV